MCHSRSKQNSMEKRSRNEDIIQWKKCVHCTHAVNGNRSKFRWSSWMCVFERLCLCVLVYFYVFHLQCVYAHFAQITADAARYRMPFIGAHEATTKCKTFNFIKCVRSFKSVWSGFTIVCNCYHPYLPERNCNARSHSFWWTSECNSIVGMYRESERKERERHTHKCPFYLHSSMYTKHILIVMFA